MKKSKKKYWLWFIIVCVFFGGIAFVNEVSPIKVEFVMSESMEPTFMTNSFVVYDTRVSLEDIKKGDVPVFYPPEEVSPYPAVHRALRDGKKDGVINTKGDNRVDIDPFGVTEDNLVGKVIGQTNAFVGIANLIYGDALINLTSQEKEFRTAIAVGVMVVASWLLGFYVIWRAEKKHLSN